MTQPSRADSRRPQPVETAETSPFWQGAKDGVLILHRCAKCGTISAPLSPRCPRCLSQDLVPFTCSGRAFLSGRTVLHLAGLPGREPPVVIAECVVEEASDITLIALDEDGVTSELAPGAVLRLGFRPDPNGWSYAVVAGTRR